MSQIPRLIRALSEPLLLEPATGRRFVSIFARKLAGSAFDGAHLHADLGIATPDARARATTTGDGAGARVAVIPVYGVIAQHALSLGASTDEIGAQFRAAMASRAVDAILFDVDSPGGTVAGVPELAAEIAAARGQKPMATISNSLMASAAYWIGSAADRVFVTPSGETGSIGVYTAHEDWSKALEQEGVKITPVSFGKYKLEGNPWEPPSEEFLASLQARVDEVGGWFIKAVAAHRRDTQAAVREGYGQGRVLGAAQSVQANLADAIGTVDDALGWLTKRVQKSPSGRSAAWRERDLTLP